MPRRFKEARKMNNMKAVEVAEKLGVATPTFSSWESGKKSPPYESLIELAQLYNVSIDYLLGNDVPATVSALTPVTKESIILHHGRPVWVEHQGWALINTVEQVLLFADGHKEPYTDLKLFVGAPRFTEVRLPDSIPLTIEEIKDYESVWVEPISSDPIRNELRGWYTVRNEFVENTRGSRFFLDSYSATWLAYNKH